MAHNWQRSVLRLMRVTNHPVTVVEVHDPTPWYRRVVFHAPELAEGLEVFPTLWLRLWVPNPARGEGFLSQRGYTVVDVRPEAGTFALEFVLHDVAGPAGDWAKGLVPGVTAEVALTPAHIALPEWASRVLLAGDVTALPAINSWIDVIPDSIDVTVLVEEGHADRDRLPRHERTGRLGWQWVTPGPERGEALAEAVLTTGSEGTAGLYAWAAGERALVRHVRSALKNGLGLERSAQFSQNYWIEGRSSG
ncbi:siderophore-interacting protein [Mycetocola reblochoni]|uniref:siderophore-interacting protein n=1 Tax=Mycetocola reblochoni TaxID=331618 RepID=UPI003F99200C